MWSRVSGLNWNICERLRSGELMAKNGFWVVAPMRMTMPLSTSGSSTSCWARLKRCSSSTKRSVRVSERRLRSAARAMTARTSATLLAVALRGSKTARVRRAMTWASAGLARAGRAVEDERGEPVGLEHAPQQLALAEEVLLADELLQRARPHAGGQRRAGTGPGLLVRLLLVEEGHLALQAKARADARQAAPGQGACAVLCNVARASSPAVAVLPAPPAFGQCISAGAGRPGTAAWKAAPQRGGDEPRLTACR